MKKHFLLFTIVLISNTGWGQEITSPSPVSEELGRYGNIQVGLFTGSPNIDIPVYDFKEGDLNVPVRLSYTTSGVRVDDINKQLGISWNLVAGGVITRTVRGKPDEKTTYLDLSGYLNYKYTFCLSQPNSSSPIYSAIDSNSDAEKDIFNFNVPGVFSGGFYFGKDNTIVQLEPSNIKIEYFLNGTITNYFKITNTDGTEYYFIEKEESSVKSCVHGSHDTHVTAWYLTKIKSVKGNEIRFTYKTEQFYYVAFLSQYAVDVVEEIKSFFKPPSFVVGQPCATNNTNFIPFLTKIDSDSGNEINFKYGTSSQELTKIEVKHRSSVIKYFNFNYTIISLGKTNSYEGPTTRFFLKNMQEISSSGEMIRQHSFEYYYPEKLPGRLSFSQDVYGYYNAANNDNIVYNNLDKKDYVTWGLSGLKANRNSNPSVSYYGMLKRITYPTGGYTEIEYEANSVFGKEYVVPPPVYQGYVSVNSEAKSNAPEYSFEIPFDQEEVRLVYASGSACDDNKGDDHAGGNIDLVRINEGNKVKSIFSAVPQQSGVKIFNGVKTKLFDSEEVTTITKGKYRLTARISRHCSYAGASIYYSTVAPYYKDVNKPYAGNRVKRTIDYTASTGEKYIKRYYYASMDNLEKSSGNFLTISPDFLPNVCITKMQEVEKNSGLPAEVSTYLNYSIASSPPVPLYSNEGYGVAYPVVIESLGGDNFEQGGIQHRFELRQEEFPDMICDGGSGENLRGVSFGNAFMSGKKISTSKFRKTGNTVTTIESTEYKYTRKEKEDIRFSNYAVKRVAIIKNPFYSYGGMLFTAIDNYLSVHMYYINTRRYELSSVTTKTYDTNGENPVTVTTTYNYDSPKHLQLTSQTSNTSVDGFTLITRYQYPPELTSDPIMTALTAANRVGIPVVTEVVRNGDGLNNKQLSRTRTLYGKNADTSQLILPTEIKANKGGFAEESQIKYDKYDNKGNPLQYTPESGIPVSIIWGYNQQYPIAKIEGAKYSEVSSYVSNLQSLSNAGKEAELTTALNNVRTKFPQYMVTTYTHKPLIGVSTITQPNGITEYYIYDNFGRLKEIQDKDKKVLKTFEYHYKQ
ncbi:MAG: hypothetical protein LBP34_00255 [Flavobacteriaceae bacterium]|jgi:hypothetical protein|nr:hypothetical protein [Flavobacteriaceae bacterium]